MFDDNSRYRNLHAYSVPERQGRLVRVVPVPPAPQEMLRGYHQRKQGQRLDHMAYRYLDDAAGFWRICELSDVMLAETLSEVDEIAIPRKRR